MRRRPLQTALLFHTLAGPCLAAPTDGTPEYVVVLSWGGQEEARWTGRLRLEGGRVGETVPWMKPYGRIRKEGSPFAFDDEADTLEAGEQEVSWDTGTKPGIPDGLVLYLSGDEATRLSLSATRSGGRKEDTALTLGKLARVAPGGFRVAAETRSMWRDGPVPGALNAWLAYRRPPMPESISRLKELHPPTPVVQADVAQAILCVPEGEAYARSARAVVDHVREQTGVTLRTVPDREIVGEDFRWRGDWRERATLIAIGNIGCSRLIARLYGMRLCFVDASWPGPEGRFVVRSIHDPFGTGRNVLLLGGSDPAGVAAAAEWLKGRATGKEIVLPPTVQVGGYGPPGWQTKSEEEFSSRLARRNIRYTAEAGLQMATHTHGERMAQRFEQLARACMAPCLEKPHDYHVSMRTGALLSVWDCIEEDLAFSDEFRLDMTNFFLTMCRQMFELRPRGLERLIRDGHADCIHAHNHMTVSAQALYLGARYFSQGYHLPETALWFRIADAFFKGSNTTHQVAENAATYGWINPSISWQHALMSGDLTYAERGIARAHADLAAVTTNNLGFITGYGDAPAYTVGPGPFSALTRAAWFYRDPEYTWFVRNVFPERGRGLYGLPGVPAGPGWTPLGGFTVCYPPEGGVRPTRLLGVTVAPLYPAPLDWYQGGIDAKLSPPDPLPEVFDKISFRENYSPDSQCLLLTGRRGGGHMHNDMNSIVNLTDRGRIWLVDSSYSERAHKDHSILALWRDGVALWTKGSAELELAADLDRFAATRTALPVGPAEARAIWRRNIVWRKGEYFLVIDDAELSAPGEYLGRCTFRALGEPAMTQERFTVEQAGEAFHILGDRGARMYVSSELNPEIQRRAGQYYPHAEPVFTTLCSNRTLRAAGPAHLIHRHLLYASGADAVVSRVEIARLTPRAVRISGPDGVGVAGVGDARGLCEVAGLRVQAEAFALDPDGLFLAGGRLCQLGASVLFAAERPVSVDLDLATGRMTVESKEPTGSTLPLGPFDVGQDGGSALELPAGRSAHRIANARDVTALIREFLSSLSQGADSLAGRQAEGEDGVQARGLSPLWQTALGGPVRHMVAARDARGRMRLVTATERGGLLVLDPAGKVTWEQELGAPVTALAVGDLGGEPGSVCIVGLEDRTIRALSLTGQEVWRLGPLPEATVANAYGRRCPNVANHIVIEDVDGDGRGEVVVTAGRVRVLDGAGAQLWQDADENVRNYDLLKALAVGDLTGDGEAEILAGTRYTYSAVFTCGMSSDRGRKVANLRNEASAMAIGRFRAGADPMLACADVGGTVYLLAADGAIKRTFAAGDRVRALRQIDFEDDGVDELLVGCDSGYVFCMDGRLRRRWHRNLRSPVIEIAPGRGPGGELLVLAATMHEGLHAIDRTGDCAALSPCPSRATLTALCVLDLDGDGTDEAALALASGQVSVLRFE